MSRFTKVIPLFLGFLCFLSFSQAVSVKGTKTLVIIENQQIKTSHSQFFDSLKEKGYNLNFQNAGSNIQLTEFGEDIYNQLIIFAPSANDFGGEASAYGLVEFMKRGGNILLATSSSIGKATGEIATECSIEFDSPSTSVIDHFNIASFDDGTHTSIFSDNVIENTPIFPQKLNKPILYKGIGHKLTEKNPLVFQILGGNPTSYSGTPNQVASNPIVLGKVTGLVSTLQALNSARITFSGSLDLFSNKFFDDQSGDNKNFALAVTSWTFHETGVIRLSSTLHHLKGETSPRQNYIIKQNIIYTVKAEQWNGEKWTTFQPKDLQLEVKMLNPYIRTTMNPSTNGTLVADLILPDVHGVFTFFIEYNRLGYSFITSSDVVPFHPLRHDQYERFIPAAFPYYASFFSMMAGFFIFSFVFLFHKDKPKRH